MRITFFGIGYVGLVSGVCLAEVGNKVICYDIDKKRIEDLKKGVSPIYEPGLAALITKNLKNNSIIFTNDINEAVANSDIYFIAVGTPSSGDGSVDMSYVESCAKSIAGKVKNNFTLVIKSTVPAGTSKKIKTIIQKILLERGLSLKFDMVSNPEFLREGTSVDDFLNPDRILIGLENDASKKELEDIYSYFKGKSEIIFTDIATAEIAKYAANAMLASRISFINEVSRICDRVGGDIGDIKKILGTDNRIGSAFLNAGVGYGGSCFPKDVKELIHFADNAGISPDLIKSIHNTNETQKKYFLEKVLELAKKNGLKEVGILGLAFKAGTDDIRESVAIYMAKRISENGLKVVAFDPQAQEGAKGELGQSVFFAKNEEEVLKSSRLILVATEWPEFKDAILKHSSEGQIIFDGRNILTLDEATKLRVEYYSVGRKVVHGHVYEKV